MRGTGVRYPRTRERHPRGRADADVEGLLRAIWDLSEEEAANFSAGRTLWD